MQIHLPLRIGSFFRLRLVHRGEPFMVVGKGTQFGSQLFSARHVVLRPSVNSVTQMHEHCHLPHAG